MNIWVQKSRLVLKHGQRGWHCKTYLDGAGVNVTERFPSGGRKSTKSPQSMAYIRQIQPGDMILLFQVDDESIYAITQADSCGMEADPGSRQYNLFYLKPAATAFRFSNPITLTELRKSGCSPGMLRSRDEWPHISHEHGRLRRDRQSRDDREPRPEQGSCGLAAGEVAINGGLIKRPRISPEPLRLLG